MNRLRWLHVSDLHFGQPNPVATWDAVQQVMLDAVRQSVQNDGPLDFVIATGDIAFSGASSEYDLADEHLDQVLAAAGTNVLIAIPGNHDLQRPKDPTQSALLVAQHAARDDKSLNAAIDPTHEVCVYLGERFTAYSAWWTKRSAALRPSSGLLPGEFSLTLTIRGLDVGFVGLNTSGGHVLDADEGDIWLHRAQLQAACQGNANQWAERHHITFLLTHHPPSWLSENAHKEYTAEIYSRRRFSAHLFGHTHEAAVAEERKAGGTPRVQLQSRSFFGLETFRSSGDTKVRRSHGFSLATWEPRHDRKALRLQYREAKLETGEWSLFTDTRIGGDLDGIIELDLERQTKALPVAGAAPTPAPSSLASAESTPGSPEHRAIQNLLNHGDTDVLPFPRENIVIRERATEAEVLISDVRQDFASSLAHTPPSFIRCLVKSGHLKYRWITQVDPLWNLVLLAEVLAFAPIIEAARPSIAEGRVFSYRFSPDGEADVFRRDSSWSDFEQRCHKLAEEHEWVVRCDIGNFYGSVSHQRLVETLEQQGVPAVARDRIAEFLKHFSDDGHGLPIGGPAARLLSEAVLTPIDQALGTDQIVYCRYSDDFALFAQSREEAEAAYFRFVDSLRTLQGLVSQDLKTRVLKSKEFSRALESHFAEGEGAVVMKLKLRWDKYADPEKKEYDRIKEAVESIDIFGLITAELAKSRINEAVTRRLVSAVRVLDESKRAPILLLLAKNLRLLTPVLSSVLQVIDSTLDSIEDRDRLLLLGELQGVAKEPGSVLLQDDSVAAYFVRLLANHDTVGADVIIDRFFRERGELVRKECIYAMSKAGNSVWLRSRLAEFERLSPWERRALLMASPRLGTEGSRLRKRVASALNSFDKLVLNWIDASQP